MSGLKIGYDAKRAFFNQTGLGNYSRNLINAMLQHYPQNRYALYTPKLPKQPFVKPSHDLVFHKPHGLLHKSFPSIWRSMWMGTSIKHDGLDIYHGLSHELPRNIRKAQTPTVVTMHDLIYERYPELYPKFDLALYRQKYRFSTSVADHVIAISEQTKQDLIQFYRVPEEKISVVYQNCNPAFSVKRSEHEIQAAKHAYHIHGDYILYVGAFIERKQALTLVQAFHKAKLSGYKLVLVGSGESAYRDQILEYLREHKLGEKVFTLSHVNSTTLPALYQGAKLFVYPSVFEGFGIPIIEALTSGTPVISTEGGCFPEAGGPDSLYVPAKDVDALSDAIQKVLSSPKLAADMSAKGREYAKRFSAESFAKDTMAVYEKVLSH